MEALLLTLDVLCMILILRAVLRVSKSGNSNDLGIFGYVDSASSDAIKPRDLTRAKSRA